MGKKLAHVSLKGKKPINTAKAGSNSKQVMITRNPSHITNKIKRSEMYGKYLITKRIEKQKRRTQREKEVEALGTTTLGSDDDDNDDDDENPRAKPPPKNIPKTLDNTREVEPTMVRNDDTEVMEDENDDEFAPYYESSNSSTSTTTPSNSEDSTNTNVNATNTNPNRPKVLITTRPRPSEQLFFFIADLQKVIPGLHFYPRKSFSIKEICLFASNRQFTHLIILSEKSKVCNGLTLTHLRPHPRTGYIAGPTAFFKVSNVITGNHIPNHGACTNHIPELNVTGFHTRLGHRIGRLLGSIFPHQDAQFQGRQVVTFHNQRDYIFVRQHRYIFNEDSNSKMIESRKKLDKNHPIPHIKTRLQELGPRFTLKLRWLQEGTFDTRFGEYEFIHKRKEMDITRRKFHL